MEIHLNIRPGDLDSPSPKSVVKQRRCEVLNYLGSCPECGYAAQAFFVVTSYADGKVAVTTVGSCGLPCGWSGPVEIAATTAERGLHERAAALSGTARSGLHRQPAVGAQAAAELEDHRSADRRHYRQCRTRASRCDGLDDAAGSEAVRQRAPSPEPDPRHLRHPPPGQPARQRFRRHGPRTWWAPPRHLDRLCPGQRHHHLASFADGLFKDYDAVRNGLTLKWPVALSNQRESGPNSQNNHVRQGQVRPRSTTSRGACCVHGRGIADLVGLATAPRAHA